MARKIRFALEMKDGVMVRSLEELAEHFDLEKLFSYIEDGRLETWLKDRYYDDMAEEIKTINIKEDTAGETLCKILDLPIAFNQENLYEFLDEAYDKIYLHGKKFEIPLKKGNVTYIGLTKPVVVIRSKNIVDWEKNKITIIDCVFDDKYLALVNKEHQKQECREIYEKIQKQNPDRTYQLFEDLYELAMNIVKGQKNG